MPVLALGFGTGVLLYLVVYSVLSPQWAVWIAFAQAVVALVAEFQIANETYRHSGYLACYGTVAALALAVVGLPFASRLNATDQTLALASYVGLYGASQLLLGIKMLFVDYRTEHPASVDPEEWRGFMEPGSMDTSVAELPVAAAALAAPAAAVEVPSLAAASIAVHSPVVPFAAAVKGPVFAPPASFPILALRGQQELCRLPVARDLPEPEAPSRAAGRIDRNETCPGYRQKCACRDTAGNSGVRGRPSFIRTKRISQGNAVRRVSSHRIFFNQL